MIITSKVSIIVCCYNVHKYLHEGRLEDIYNQTYTNWELILVDDGSTDGTSNFLDNEAKKDSRIIVIHKSNGGLGSARNAGLDVATGDYIWAFDVDDHVELDTVEYCVKEAENKNVDVLMFGLWVITPHLNTIEKVQLHETIIKNHDELKKAYLDKILFVSNGNGYFCNKFYRREFIEKHNLRFGNQRIQQDELFNLKVYEHLEKCYISPKVFYHYFIYNIGNNRSNFIADRFQIYKSIYTSFRHLQQIWGINDERFDNYLYKRFYSNVEDCLTFNLFHPKCNWNNTEKQSCLETILNDYDVIKTIEYRKANGLTLQERIRLYSYYTKNQFIISSMIKLFSFLKRIKHKC